MQIENASALVSRARRRRLQFVACACSESIWAPRGAAGRPSGWLAGFQAGRMIDQAGRRLISANRAGSDHLAGRPLVVPTLNISAGSRPSLIRDETVARPLECRPSGQMATTAPLGSRSLGESGALTSSSSERARCESGNEFMKAALAAATAQRPCRLSLIACVK
jgi:hypothetical protein